MGMRDVFPRGRRNASPTRRREVGRIRRGVVQVRKVLLHTSSVTFGDSFSSRSSLGAVQNGEINFRSRSCGSSLRILMQS